MELVENIWPIVDQETGIVQRFLIRAYAMSASDEEVSVVLRAGKNISTNQHNQQNG